VTLSVHQDPVKKLLVHCLTLLFEWWEVKQVVAKANAMTQETIDSMYVGSIGKTSPLEAVAWQ